MHASRLLLLAFVSLAGCRREPAQSFFAPVELTVKQRSTSDVPGTDGTLRLTIGDITGGQVRASLADSDGKTVLAPISLSQGDHAKFELGSGPHQLSLTRLNNALIGEDFATFIISTATADVEPETEQVGPETAKIEALIAAVESAEGLIFIRNDAEHSASEAADHLRSKWRAAGNQVQTAEQFIKYIGSRSSSSGEPYRVKLPDGKEMPAGEWLRERLTAIRDSPPKNPD